MELLVNSTPDLDKCYINAFNWYEQNGAPGFLESMQKSGVCILFPFISNTTGGAGMEFINGDGIIGFNFSESILNKLGSKIITNEIIYHTGMESMGIAQSILKNGWDFAQIGIEKGELANDYYNALYKKTKNSFYKGIADYCLNIAKGYATDGGDLNDPLVVTDIKWIKDNNLISIAGFKNWQEVDKLIGNS